MVKRIFKLMCAAAACSALFACTKAELKENSPEKNVEKKGELVTIYASVEQPAEDKVALNGTAFSWKAGDEIAVIDYVSGQSYKFTARQDGSENVPFDCDDIEDASSKKLYFAVYPYVESDLLYVSAKASDKGTYHNLRFDVPTQQTGLLEDAPHRLLCNANRHEGKFIFQSGVSYWKFSVPEELNATKLVFRHETNASASSRYLSGGYQARVTHKEGEEDENLGFMAFSSTDNWFKRSNETVIYRDGAVISGDVYLVIGEMNTEGLDFTVRVEKSNGEVGFMKLENSKKLIASRLYEGGSINPSKFYKTEVLELDFENAGSSPYTSKALDMGVYFQSSLASRIGWQFSHKYVPLVSKSCQYAWTLYNTKAVAFGNLAGIRLNSHKTGSYIDFPIVKGKRLVKAEVEFGRNNPVGGTKADSLCLSGLACIADASSQVLKDSAGNAIGAALTDQHAQFGVWDLYGAPGSKYKATYPDSTYRLLFNAAQSADVLKIKLTYIGEEVERVKSIVNYTPKNYVQRVQFQGRVRATSGINLTTSTLGFDYQFGDDEWKSVAAGDVSKLPAFTSAYVAQDSYYGEPVLPVALKPYVIVDGEKVYGPLTTYKRVLLNFTTAHEGLTSVTGLAVGATATRSFVLHDNFANKDYTVTMTFVNKGTAAVDAMIVNEKNIVLKNECEVTFKLPDMEDYGCSRICVGFANTTASTFTTKFTARMKSKASDLSKVLSTTTNTGGKPAAGFNPFIGNNYFPTYQGASDFNGMDADDQTQTLWVKEANDAADCTLSMVCLMYE